LGSSPGLPSRPTQLGRLLSLALGSLESLCRFLR